MFLKDWGKTASTARGTVELNRLFLKDWGKTASAARILSPNPTRRPLPCFLIQSFFYGVGEEKKKEREGTEDKVKRVREGDKRQRRR